ncbi:MAG: hypothetical protein LBQ45_00305 [Mycoplasmataceae bacterium]|nr:hypothetical protein [Mycoplasmataceae bacterium]
MDIKFSHLTNIKTERKIVHILLIAAFAFAFICFITITWTGLWLYAPTVITHTPNLDLSGKRMGLYEFDSHNNWRLAWYGWTLLSFLIIGLALLGAALMLEHTWKFKLAKHQLTYFNVYPIFGFVVLFAILMFCSVPHTEIITPAGGGSYIGWKNWFSYYHLTVISSSEFQYHDFFTPFGWTTLILAVFLLFYQIKVSAALIWEIKNKWGDNMHVDKFNFENVRDTQKTYKSLFFNKKKLAFKLTWIDMILTTCITIILIVIATTVPAITRQFDALNSKLIPALFLPLVWLFYMLISAGVLVYLHYTTKDDSKQHWFDIITIILGGTLTSVGGIILLTDWWYEYKHMAKKELIEIKK